MLTGFEALGAASAVLQVISFSGDVISQCYGIYNGKLTPEHELEQHATLMIDAADRVQSRYAVIPQATEDEKKLAQIAKKCVNVAKELEAETKRVTTLCQKGKLSNTFRATFGAKWHKSKVERLEKSLHGHRQVMEMQLIVNLCTKSDAIELQQSTGFQRLDADVQDLLRQIGKGHTRIEDLVRTEHNTTRDAIKREAKATRDEVNIHLSSEVQALRVSAATDTQRQNLLKSLKVSEMNQRYHAVMSPEDSSFERVFLSYESVTGQICNDLDSSENEASEDDNTVSDDSDLDSESMSSSSSDDSYDVDLEAIDQSWSSFTSWIQLDNNEIFWIRGKPGSGKSTLMKFVMENDNTQTLLEQGSPGTKVLSHFFWKIGSSPQNSIKGLLCSLLHGALTECDGLVDQVLNEFKAAASKDSYHDWSVRELNDVFFSVLQKKTWPVCIFIDGLDEISDQDGFSKLMDLVEHVNSCDEVKLCVSSRPERRLLERLEAAGAATIRLEDLTRPEMHAFIQKQLSPFRANGQLSALFLERLADMLLYKAEGVFLWIFLATKSLITGIQNQDDEKTLSQRLKELPAELEGLYAEMWRRLNAESSVYREMAGRYFRYVAVERSAIRLRAPRRQKDKREGAPDLIIDLQNITLLEVAFAEAYQGIDVRSTEKLNINNKSVVDTKRICEVTKDNIITRCAGLLQVTPGSTNDKGWWLDGADGLSDEVRFCLCQVDFIHRTAHDFLAETGAGRCILNYKSDRKPPPNVAVALMRSFIDMTRTLHTEGSVVVLDGAIGALLKVAREDKDGGVTMGFAKVLQDLFERRILHDGRPGRSLPPPPPFVSRLALESPDLDDVVVSLLEREQAKTSATDVIRDAIRDPLLHLNQQSPEPLLPIIQRLILSGADPHIRGIPSFTHLSRHSTWLGCLGVYTYKVTTFEICLLGLLRWPSQEWPPAMVDEACTMARMCPHWGSRLLISKPLGSFASFLGWDSDPYHLHSYSGWYLICEVNLQFLLGRFLAPLDQRESRLQKLGNTLIEPVARVRYIMRHDEVVCYRILSQKPFQHVIGNIMDEGLELDNIEDLVADQATVEEVDFDSELECLADEELGLCRWGSMAYFQS